MPKHPTVTCPDGHQSEATDWCDTCGIAIGAATSGTSAPATAEPPAATPKVVPAGDCPNCGTAHHEGEAFCEVCGLDFDTGELPETPAAVPVEAEPVAVDPGEDPTGKWTVTIDADADWFARNEAESGSVVSFPEGAPVRTVVLTGDVVTIGRRDDKRGWYPTIDLGVPVLDPSSSRQHAELRAVGDTWQVVDLDSTNGTTVNGERIKANSPVDVLDGTVILLGAFTRVTAHAPTEAAS